MRILTLVVATSWLLPTAGALAQVAGKEQGKEQAKKPAPAPARPEDLAKRVEDLEAEVARLRLQQPGEEGEEEEAAAPASPPQAGPVSANAFNPTVTAVGNGLYRHDDKDVLSGGTPIDNQFNLREVELDLRAAVDPFADGVAILSFESEVPGQFEAGVEEGYVIIKRLPVPLLDEPPFGLQFKVGRFRPEIGRINVLHLHDLPQMTRPLVVEEFFGEEGYVGNGVSARLLLPGFDPASAFELTGQLLTGGGVAVADGPAQSPAAIANLRWFRTFAGAHNVDLSAIFHFARTDPAATRNAFTFSGDFLYKWKPLRQGEFRSFVLGGQVFATRRDFVEELDTNGDGEPDAVQDGEASPLGYFGFAQYQVSRTTYLGARWDDTATITDDSVRRRAISAYATWYTSEFLRLRLGYEHRMSDLDDEDGRNSIFAELNFVFGAHPPEPFWVNK
ncbi:MAG TPA: hypothetical protein VEL05_10260 [Candidatus Acidoferrum sp.]|nr:hypothetical protein [Candidatus Acidoferrum sp.]